MRKLALAAAFLAVFGAATAAPALAQQEPAQPPPTAPNPPAPKPPGDTWSVLHFSDGAMGWNLNAGRWFDNNDTAEGQRLLHYANPQEVDGQTVAWVHEFWRIRCKANTYQIKQGEELNAGLGLVFTLKEGPPFPIKDNSPESVLKRVYCDNVEVGGQHATGIVDAIDAMRKPKPAQ